MEVQKSHQCSQAQLKCFNCSTSVDNNTGEKNSEFSETADLTDIKEEYSSNYQKISASCDYTTCVEALQHIYKFGRIDVKHLLEQQMSFCSFCSNLLKNIHRDLNEFETLTNTSSIIYQMVKDKSVKVKHNGNGGKKVGRSELTETEYILPTSAVDDELVEPKLGKVVQIERPDFSAIQLVLQALLSAPGCKSKVRGIYLYVAKNYPFYADVTRYSSKWQTYIRGALSTAQYFVKLPNQLRKGVGYQCFWTLDPRFDKQRLAAIAFQCESRQTTIVHPLKPAPLTSYLHRQERKRLAAKKRIGKNNLQEVGHPEPEIVDSIVEDESGSTIGSFERTLKIKRLSASNSTSTECSNKQVKSSNSITEEVRSSTINLGNQDKGEALNCKSTSTTDQNLLVQGASSSRSSNAIQQGETVEILFDQLESTTVDMFTAPHGELKIVLATLLTNMEEEMKHMQYYVILFARINSLVGSNKTTYFASRIFSEVIPVVEKMTLHSKNIVATLDKSMIRIQLLYSKTSDSNDR